MPISTCLALALLPFAAGAADSVVLENAHCRLEIDPATGDIASLTPGPESLRGSWFEVVEEDRSGLAPWETWEHGEENVFAGGEAEISTQIVGETSRARILWRRPSGLRIIGEIELAAEDLGPRFHLTVRNTTGQALVDTIRLPVLRGIEVGDPADDWFTWPHTLGARFRVKGLDPGQMLSEAYPDFMYMQWLDLYDADRGVYVGCLDDYGYSKDLFIGREESGDSVMGISFTGCWIAERGDSWTTPWVQIAAHEGDWRSGAAMYRPFAQDAFGPLDPPQRVWDMPTSQCWLAHHASDGDVGDLFEIQQQAPIHASYLMKSLNTSIPEGWDGFRGSALEYERAFDKIRAQGGSPALFTFDRAPLMGRPNYAEYASRWTLHDRNRSFAEGFRDMMPSPFDPAFVKARVGEAVRWVQAFGLDEIHYDTAATTGAGLAGPSYGAPHRPNEVPHYFKALYRAIRDACREHNPEFILRAEHCADFFYPEFLTSTAHLFVTGTLVAAHNPPDDAQLMPILFRHTLPRHAALQMPSQSANDFWTYANGMGHGFHGGGPSWSFNPGVREAESPPGELLHRYRFYTGEWRRYYDFRVGLAEAVVEGDASDIVTEALIDGQWQRCDYPGPVIAVTHSGGGREATLGQWYPLSDTPYYAARFAPDSMDPRPIRLRVPTALTNPRVKLLDERGEVPTSAKAVDGVIEVEIPDPTCFALEVSESPFLDGEAPRRAEPGDSFEWRLTVSQDDPQPGRIAIELPAGWPAVEPISVPAEGSFSGTVLVQVPEGVFGRCYPLKAVFTSEAAKRTWAGNVLVMEPLTVLYGFNSTDGYAVDPGKPAHLTVTCVNNTADDADVEIAVTGPQVSGTESHSVAGVSLEELTDPDGALRQWTDNRASRPGNASSATFDFDCTGVPEAPTDIRVTMDGETVFETSAYPRTRLMDLGGEWRVHLEPRSRARVGGAEKNDNLDTEAVTPDVWDGEWQSMTTPIALDKDVCRDTSWAIYRRMVFLPAKWRGADIQLRLGTMGAPWGAGGTLNLVYVNGWPSGRIGTSGECSLSSFLVFGGWNLIAVASDNPNSLKGPYLFVRDAPAPARLQPTSTAPRPEGAFLQLGERPTGQGMNLIFIQGVPGGGSSPDGHHYRRREPVHLLHHRRCLHSRPRWARRNRGRVPRRGHGALRHRIRLDRRLSAHRWRLQGRAAMCPGRYRPVARARVRPRRRQARQPPAPRRRSPAVGHGRGRPRAPHRGAQVTGAGVSRSSRKRAPGCRRDLPSRRLRRLPRPLAAPRAS